ncbi:GntR family transcriptional regulator [Pelagibacterium nitratireducens]|jgi:GntR family transcriptional regulator|uniref:GntR family transcriptional regulator n=1 Tax=Pelagibacterium nitratireducens TaxID=1046114 RepID=A0ABZ2HXN3_9HYPH|nr:GntR family transcriptional regulator [Pelagibacterium sp.]HCO54402.1 GntR family transcriptional regulator [Pelagibacterium sp.]|tara:strand:+ start:15646 stop:16002 length:357 start_codon:yes stop_codon:yes gene_type:complete
MTQWRDDQPIFLQIRQRMIEMILNGAINEGDPLPSVRQVATDLSVNPLTVTKSYQSLVDMGTVEKRRGLGMYVTEGARAALLAHERDKFLKEDWPAIAARISALGLSTGDLLKDGDEK